MKMIDWAVGYAMAGALVVPLHTPTPGGCSCRKRDCEHPGKHPRTLHGKDDATSDVETVTRWWSAWPDANIGIRPHPGHVVVDVDPRNGGDAQFEAMQRRSGALPATRTARTGSGGLHVWFTFFGAVRGRLDGGIDIKSHKGYVVAPPSIHASGGKYEWINDGPILPAPPYLRRLLARPEPPVRSATAGAVTPAVIAGLVRTVADAPNGNLNNTLYWACARAHERGIDTAPLVDAAVAAGHPRWTAERTALSAANAPAEVR